uniref:Putative secreted protein n=1 Tax=Ixodes ricinus TaxID=34613 RepID=A0A6B0V255_IXORI
MALEGVFLLLHLGAWIQVLHCHATFNGAEHKALLVGETANAARLVLEVRVPPLLDVAHVAQVPDENLAQGRAHHQLVTAHRHGVHPFSLVEGAGVGRGAGIPQLDRGVPTARDDHIDVGTVLDAAHGGCVLPHHRLRAAVEVERLDLAVHPSAPGVHCILKGAVQDWTFVAVLETHGVTDDVVQPHVRVPGRDKQELV